jgi:hypothetical protein
MKITLIGGPLNGTVKDIPESFPVRIEPNGKVGEDKDNLEYLVCRTIDGVFYGVYEPQDDPSLMRIQRLRNAIQEAVDRMLYD